MEKTLPKNLPKKKAAVPQTESLDDDFFDGEINIEEALDNVINQANATKTAKKSDLMLKASKNRQEKNEVKKELGIRRAKQSKFPNRAHAFLSEPISDRAVHFVLNNHRSEAYKDGADLCPRILMGIPAYNKPSKKNAFEHLIDAQEKIRDGRSNGEAYPKWIIISTDSSMITDRNLITRLEELRPTTHVASAYGFENIRMNGRWFDINDTDQNNLRGCYIQGNMTNTDWDFVIGSGFKDSPRWRVLIAHGPFIAVRGETFMDIDFSYMAERSQKGFYHFMADISMECLKRNLMVAQIKTTCIQYDNMTNYRGEPEFENDQSVFTSKWQENLPNSIYRT